MFKRLLGFALTLIVASALLMAGCAGSHHGAGGAGSGALTVSSTAPAFNATSVSTSTLIAATFSEPMRASSVTTSSFSAASPAGPLKGTVSCVDNTATFQPKTLLPTGTVITVTVTKAAVAQNGDSLATNYVWSFTTGTTADTTPPTVSSTDPADLETGVSVNRKVSATFSEPMAAASVNTTTFKLQSPSGPVTGVVTLLSNVATFSPAANLLPSTVYTATITTGVTDLSGNALAVNKVWTFTTGVTADTTPPTVLSTDPAASATGVPLNKTVSATFSEAMDASTITSGTFQLRSPNGALVTANISYAHDIAVLSPTSALTANTIYTAVISPSVKDLAGNAMANSVSWHFTTAGTTDTTPPTVLSTTPADLATNVFLNASINATFSEAMLASSINTSTFSVAGVSGTVTYDAVNHIATFKPSADLAPNTTYTATIGTGAKDAEGNSLVNPKIWSFTTGVQRSQSNINLGSASTFAVLAGSTVTNGGPTIINGDLGVSPGTAVTGFPPGTVNGAIHAGDSAAAQAKSDLLAAQLDAAGRLGGAALPGDLAGLTFTPGLYTNSTSTMLSTGAVTLDAQGDPNAVFIFQMGSTLTTATGTQVVLAGGAKPSNIYWSVGSSATIGVNSIFKGIILAEASITVNTGAVSDGVFLTHTAAVTLESNTVTRNLPHR